ncbi:beta-ketoacyl synthase N-terminal-like domain-containing protein, partial [Streptomyces bohaiensis]|uniref:beta-ketoacyl synthase N-terminal-like domain-containing protein n=1 Tax=Streptomyces bohaiensis TaxID=1431344 RepID=UPI0030C76C9F
SPAAEGAVLSAVRAAVATATGEQVADDVAFFDLGLTSVALARVRASLERDLGTTVAAAAFYEHPTVADLTRHLADRVARAATAPSPATAPPHGPGGNAPTDGRIAIIGISARFPGAPDIDRFWANLREGRDSVSDFGGTADADPALRPVAGVLDDVDAFDAGFFGISRAEARLIDPAHRLFLETCYLALEHGGYAGTAADRRIGVYAGSGMHLYGHQDTQGTGARHDDGTAAVHAATGGLPDFVATRVAHRLNLTGPAIGVQTACSTSLVAVHLAVQALLAGDADLALAGAAAVRLPQEAGYRYEPGSILSGSGRCRPFDADADGTVGGNGVAAVLLKPLDRALADGDTVHAVIAGTAVNNDGGAKAGFTAPSVGGHADVVSAALRRAGVAANTISYVEAHGTGTAVGDPVEFRALTRALGDRPAGADRCALGSVKGNVGHLDTCAGMAGLIKTVLMLRHRELVPTVNLARPHPDMDWSGGPFRPATELRPWVSPDGGPLRAGVSALGVGGTNAHVVLQEAPPTDGEPRGTADTPVVLPLSASDAATLAELVTRVADHLDGASAPPAADVVRTLALGRRHLSHRRAVTGRTTAELVAALRESDRIAERATAGPLAFAFSGQGDIRPGSAARLYADFPRARAVLDRCEALFRACAPEAGGLLERLCAPVEAADAGEPWPTATAQVALFSLQVAQAAVWQGIGVHPAVVLGHSVGEYAALHTAGALSLEDGVRLTAERGRLMQATAPGGMVAVVADAARSAELAARCGLEVAAANAPGHHVLAGAADTVAAAGAVLDAEGVTWRALAVDRAFHTALMDEALDGLRAAVDRVELHPLRLPLVTTADAVRHPVGTVPDGDYLVAQARRAVEFAGSLATVAASDTTDFLELGPGRVLCGIGRRALPDSRWTPTLATPDGDAVRPAVATLYEQGVDPDWTELTPEGRRVPLPAHPLRRTRFEDPAQPASTTTERADADADADAPAGTAGTSGSTAAAVEPVSVAEVAATVAAEQAGAVLSRVREVVGKRLGATAEEVDTERTFLEQGADSLSMMAAARDLATEFDVRVPVRDLFGDSDTPEKLARAIADQLPAPAAPVAPEPPAAPPAPAAAPATAAAPAVPP